MQRAGAGRRWLIWVAVVPIVAWAIVRGFGLESGFPLDALIAYTPYVAVAALLIAGVALALRNWAAALIGMLALVWLAAGIAPRAIGHGEDAQPGDLEVEVLAANVHHGTANPADLIDLVERRGVDVMSVEELTPRFAHDLRRGGLGVVLPHSVLSMRSGASGGGIYSRYPLARLPAPPTVGFRMPRARIALPGSRSLRVVAVHPHPPEANSTGSWSAGLHSLPSPDPDGEPWILPGDFNATLDHAELRRILDLGYRDAAEVTGKGLIPTWPEMGHNLPPVTIDHILAERRIRILSYEVDDIPGSDHRAVYARLAVPPSLSGHSAR
ncbi:MAG TPA: endonuclease/exonuclease/phosphatase family protein [Solirubrobacterales bacterium]|nr:endonuclease/exonuclease/phosphatase family protein [Solirubrobacterales bacterium]